MKLFLLVLALATSSPISDPCDWVRMNRPTALTWGSFSPELVKTMKGTVDSLGVIYGHFYSDKSTDAAILSTQEGHLVFEVVKCTPTCTVDVHEDMSSGMEGIRFVADGISYLTLVPKGQLVETSPAIEGEDKHVKLTHDAIQVATFEKAAVVWYWDEKLKKWDTVSTAD